jgi:predicted phage tail protein
MYLAAVTGGLFLSKSFIGGTNMEFFSSAVSTLQTLVIALGAGLAVWGIINLLEGYGNDNPGANGQGP